MHSQFLVFLSFVCGLAGLALAAASAPPQAPAAKKLSHKVVRVTGPDARRPAEVAVAINPTNPEHVVAVSNQGRGPDQGPGNHAYASHDGGITWKAARFADLDRRIQGDDVIAFGPDGTAFRACIAFQGIRQSRPARANSGIYVTSSRDGLTWGAHVPVVDHVNTVEPFEDKPWMIADLVPDSPHRGNLYVAWTRFDVYGSKAPAHKSHIWFSRSRDGCRGFSPAVRISDKPGDCVDSSNTVEGAVPAVGTKGEVYVAWAGPEGLVFDRSTDGGFSFGADKVITKTPGGWNIPAAGLSRHNGMPVLGVDHSAGAHRGSLYVSWIDKRHGDPDVFVAASRDGGDTWGEPVRVNDDPQGKGTEQLFAWMAVDPRDGALNVIFYDRRDLKDSQTGLTLARSVDGGRTFVNYKVDQEPFACSRAVFFGDYIGVAASQGRVVAVYSHFLDPRQLALSAAVFRFKPGTQEIIEEAGGK